MTTVYLMRHGHAEDGLNKPDEARELTPHGVEKVKRAAQVIKRLKVKPAYIFSSPRIRALHTAEIVAKALELPVQVTEDVNFGFHTQIVANYLQSYAGNDLMFVGHEPTMSGVIAEITGADVAMKKGSLARLDIVSFRGKPKAVLVWLIAPAVFDALDKS